jgi:chromosome segregation ATPase
MAKIDNMTALNAFLKEQAEAKERQVRDLEERLRRQEDDVKRAYAELDAKTAKLKKRETLINQALKRLEAINFVVPSSAAAAALGRDGGKENKDEELRNLEF